MVSLLLTHAWKKFSRSVSLTRDVATMIFLGFFALMIMGYTLALGFSLELIITQGLDQSDSIGFLNGLLLYYFVFEFLMRYFLQNLPVLEIQPYLHLPLKKSRIIHYMLLKSLGHMMNIMVFLLFAPFAFRVIDYNYGSLVAWNWVFFVWLLSMSLHYLIILFKKRLDNSFWGVLILVLLFSGLGAADYFGWFKLSQISSRLFGFPLQYYFVVLIPALALLFLYSVNFRYFLQSVYPDELTDRGKDVTQARDWAFLRNFGEIGEMINVEIKLILRNKRPRTILFLSAFFLLYGLIFYPEQRYTEEMPGFLLFVGIFITGIFMINYGQMLFSWQGGHYDFTLTRPVSLRQYVESKYWLLSTVTIVCFLLSIPYVYFGWKILFVHLSMTLFNLGVNVFVIINIAMWQPKRIDLRKGGAFNYEGVGAAQWIMGIPILAGPYLFYLPFSFSGYPDLGILAVGVIGLVGLALRRSLLNLTVNRLKDKKYIMAAGFRRD